MIDDLQAFDRFQHTRSHAQSTAAVQMSQAGLQAGTKFDRYLILEEIGRGGMGVVYKVLHTEMLRTVALKVLPPEALNSTGKVRRFRHEIKAISQLSHPNIITAHDAGDDKGVYFLVMEFVEGRDLSRVVARDGPVTAAEAVSYILQAARALDHAHALGIVHRDVKPSNLMLAADGSIKLLDLGLAQLRARLADESITISADSVATDERTFVGTVGYTSVEQAFDAQHVDHRADIYGLGCTLHYLLTGQPPYRAEGVMQTLLAHKEAPIPSLRTARADISGPLDAAFRRMIAKSPGDRYGSMAEAIAVLELIAASPPESARPRRPKVSSRMAAALAIALCIAVTGCLVIVQILLRIQPVSDPNRSAALWALKVRTGGNGVGYKLNGQDVEIFTQSIAELPDAPFRVTRIDVWGTEAVDDEEIRKLAGLQHVEYLGLYGTRVGDVGLRDTISKLVTLRFVDLGGIKDLTDAGAETLANLPHLETLRLGDTNITDQGLRSLSEIESMQRLTLTGTRVSNLGIESLNKFKNLANLELKHLPITDSGVQQLRYTPSLYALDLNQTEITDVGVQTIAKRAPWLTELYIGCSNVGDPAISALLEMDKLSTLDLAGSQVSDASIPTLSRLIGLKWLELTGTAVTDDGLVRLKKALPGCNILPTPDALHREAAELILAKGGIVKVATTGALPSTMSEYEELPRIGDRTNLPSGSIRLVGVFDVPGPLSAVDVFRATRVTTLRSMCIPRSPIGDEGLRHIGKQRDLMQLLIDGCGVSNVGLVALDDLRKLEWLSLGEPQLTGSGLAYLGNRPLKHLTISNYMHDEGLEAIGGLRGLEVLELNSDQITDAGLRHLRGLNLREFLLSSRSITEAGLEFLNSSPELQMLTLLETPLTDSYFSQLARMPNLRTLVLGRTKTTGAGLSMLQGLAHLEALHIEGNDFGDDGVTALPKLRHLQVVVLRCTSVSDAGIPVLSGLTGLKRLDLTATAVTDGGLKRLKKTLPGCEILPAPSIGKSPN
jgi:eukaryotic-like serine/threonine-protein kinase